MIAWTDVETTGLEEAEGHLLEVALVLTDDDLEEIAAERVAIRPVGVDIDDVEMEPEVRLMHTNNGLIDEIRSSGLRLWQAHLKLCDFVREQTVSRDIWSVSVSLREAELKLKDVPLAGSSIGFDRRWLRYHMTALEAMFSHQSIDVSSLTQLAKRWSPLVYAGRPKSQERAHRALLDVRESIEYLRYYRQSSFIVVSPVASGIVGHAP